MRAATAAGVYHADRAHPCQQGDPHDGTPFWVQQECQKHCDCRKSPDSAKRPPIAGPILLLAMHLSFVILRATARRPVDARAFLLDWWARYRPIGAKHATVAALGPQHLGASLAGIEADACIGRHRLGLLVTAVRAGDGRAKLQLERLLSHELPNHHHFRRSPIKYRVSSVS